MILNSTFLNTHIIRGGIGLKKIRLSGYLIDENGSPVSTKGFVYGDTISMESTIEVVSDEPYFSAVIGAKTGVLYYRSFSKNEYGIGYGEIKSIEV